MRDWADEAAKAITQGWGPRTLLGDSRRDIATALRDARAKAIDDAAQALLNPALPGDLPFGEAADVVRALNTAAPAQDEER